MDDHVTLLVIDDDTVDRASVRRALKSSGVQTTIIEAADRAEALAALQQASFDCILLDYRLPDADGLEVLRAIRAAGTNTPVIILTGQGDEQVAVELMKAGAADYLAKSRLSADRLTSSIRHALRIHQAEIATAEAQSLKHQAEVALRQNERLLAITLKSIGDAVIATDATGAVMFMNRVAESLTSWTALAATGQRIEQVLPLVHARSRLPIPSLAAQVMRAGTTVEISDDVVVETRDGQRFPIAISCAPIRGDDGALVGVVVVFRDMTEQVRTAERLRFLADVSHLFASSLDYEAQLAQLAQLAVPQLADFCAIDVVRSDTTIERIAVATSELVRSESSIATKGYIVDASQPYGSPTVIRAAHTEYYPDITVSPPPQLLDDDRAFVAATDLISWICVPLLVRGSTLGVISVGRTAAAPRFSPEDVALVEELAQRASLAVDNALLYQEAKEAIQARDAFLSIAAHELKTPLTSLQGYAELLQRRASGNPYLEERDRRVITIITDQGRRLNKMIQALFDVSRLQIGQLRIERSPVDLGRLATRITHEIEPTLERHSVHLVVDDAPLVILGDELRLEQVIQNLLHNAMKYSPNGGPIFVGVARREQWVRLSVQDQGIGIPSESLTGIFQRFFRATNTETHNISGMGIGLYVARQIVDLHGGRIEVESVEGQGSTFSIWLPLEAGASGTEHGQAAQEQPMVTNGQV